MALTRAKQFMWICTAKDNSSAFVTELQGEARKTEIRDSKICPQCGAKLRYISRDINDRVRLLPYEHLADLYSKVVDMPSTIWSALSKGWLSYVTLRRKPCSSKPEMRSCLI